MYRATLDKKAMELPKMIPTSILAAAALGLMLGLAFTPALAAPNCDLDKHKDKPVCNDDSSGNAATYMVKLTSGPFAFGPINPDPDPDPDPPPTEYIPNATLNDQGNSYRSIDKGSYKLLAPEDSLSAEYDIWENVFANCNVLLKDSIPTEVTIVEDGWSIDQAGPEVDDIRVIFYNAFTNEYENAKIDFQLITFYNKPPPFAPKCGTETSTFFLRNFRISGQDHGKKCQPPGSGQPENGDLVPPITLEITAPACP
jgi:hypothetical protein